MFRPFYVFSQQVPLYCPLFLVSKLNSAKIAPVTVFCSCFGSKGCAVKTMKRLTLLLLSYLLGLILVLVLTFYLASDFAYREARQQAQYEADNVAEYINSELARYQNIPQLLASNYLIRKTLQDQAEFNQNTSALQADTTELNRLLMEIGESAGADDIYVMDRSGIVLAASNYNTPRDFVGGNFAFRPYFYRALAGDTPSYYAMGLRSGERGAFFSAPIAIDDQVMGVVAVKIAISKFEQNTALLTGDPAAHMIGYGRDQVIFISNRPEWRLKQLAEPEGISWQQILDSQRYLNIEQKLLNQSINQNILGQELWQMNGDSQASSPLSRYSFGKASIPALEMDLAILLPYKMALQALAGYLLSAAVTYLLLAPAGFFLYRRVAGYRPLLYTRSSLEQEIKARTEELDKAHKALIQSAKLATIGQLAASINHEINQPLSAISTYLVSSRRMLMKGKTESLLENLNTIESLIHRTHQIVSQLKQFSRVESDHLKPVSLQQSLQNALLIVGPELKQQGVHFSYDKQDSRVMAEPLKLEQVMVNLLSNAAEAMRESTGERRINLQIEQQPEATFIEIRDTGPGLDLQKIDTIFEPFFTTKSNHGSGLGLSIARSIIDSFGGALTADNSPEGGAVFTLILKRDLS